MSNLTNIYFAGGEMGNYSKPANLDIKKTSVQEHFENTENYANAILDQALSKSMDIEIAEIEEKYNNMKIPPYSKHHKIRMNRLFRERVGGSFLPFPEVDNLYERLRSKLIKKLKKRGFPHYRKEPKRKK